MNRVYYAIKRGKVNRFTTQIGSISLFGLFGSRAAANEVAMGLYEKVVVQARQPQFYTAHGVPDTPDGRYDMIMLHAFLLLHRLKLDHGETEDTAQAFFDLMFEDMDKNLREMGAGDVGIGRRIKDMAKAFYGRIAAYEEGLNADDDTLETALRRNIYRNEAPTAEQVAHLALYMRREAASLKTQSTAALLQADLSFGNPEP